MRDPAGRRVAVGARHVFDIELLTQPFGQFKRHYPGDEIGGPAGRKSDHNPERPVRVGPGPREARAGRKCGGGGCQTQKLTAWKPQAMKSVGPPDVNPTTTRTDLT